LAALLAACATASPVMPVEDGTYLISAHAAPARGGAAGAQGYAFEQAQAFCAAKGQHAVVVAMADRDVQQSAFSATPNAAFGASLPGGNANLRFRCAS
jgi:hypothetical protein